MGIMLSGRGEEAVVAAHSIPVVPPRHCCPPQCAGESVAVMKCTEAVSDAQCELQAKENMLFGGTAIANGTAIGVVTAIGMDTEIGKIQSQIQVGLGQGMSPQPHAMAPEQAWNACLSS